MELHYSGAVPRIWPGGRDLPTRCTTTTITHWILLSQDIIFCSIPPTSSSFLRPALSHNYSRFLGMGTAHTIKKRRIYWSLAPNPKQFQQWWQYCTWKLAIIRSLGHSDHKTIKETDNKGTKKSTMIKIQTYNYPKPGCSNSSVRMYAMIPIEIWHHQYTVILKQQDLKIPIELKHKKYP